MNTEMILVTADWHLRSDTPRCRTDEDWIETQRYVIRQIFDIAINKKCDIIHAGDIFDRPNVPNAIMNMLIIELKRLSKKGLKFYFIAGNHDLPHHSYSMTDNSSYGILKSLSNDVECLMELNTDNPINDIIGVPFGQQHKISEDMTGIIILHDLIMHPKDYSPIMAGAKSAPDVLRKYKKANLIIAGDYHHGYFYKKEHQYLLVPGVPIRQSADLIDYKPHVVLFSDGTDDNGNYQTQTIDIPINDIPANMDIKYLENQKERDEGIKAFISVLEAKKNITLNFRENIQKELNTLPEDVQEMVFNVCDLAGIEL